MVQIASLTVIVSLLASYVAGAPIIKRCTDEASGTAAAETAAATTGATNNAGTGTAAAGSGSFQLLDYAQFQISDGVAGNALAEAQAIFVDPFAGVDLATLDASVATDMETMRKAAENAETELFNPAIEAATGAEKDALSAGKTKNKVLKLTAFNQVLAIKIAKATAAGDDTSSLEEKLAAETTKLNKNVAADEANAGAASQAA